jgi:uncharacterized protein (DUF1800 family)
MNRRNFLAGLAGPLRHAERDIASDPAPPIPFSLTPGLEPYAGPWTKTTAAHLLRRALLAPTYAELQEGASMTMGALVERLLSPPDSFPGAPRYITEWLNAEIVPWDSGRAELTTSFFDEARRWWLGLMINSGMSIRERMTLFWHNHFATSYRLITDARTSFLQNQLFRRHATGDFKALVRAVTIDPAMLDFLNGRNNKAGYVNENYARELQELFTIGLADNDGVPNYTQDDIVQAARTLTGWDYLGYGSAVDSNLLTGHDAVATKRVYGETIQPNANGGPELDRLLEIIFAREETARYIIRKLYRFFVHTDVPLTPISALPAEIEEKIIAPLAAEFRASGWSIATVLRTLLSSTHFYDPGIMGATIKSPADFLAGFARATRTGPMAGDQFDYLTQALHLRATTLGQELFAPPGVQGWGFYRSWISTTTLPQRHSYTDELIEGTAVNYIERLNVIFAGPIYRSGVAKIDVLAYARQFPSFASDPDALASDIAGHLLAYPPSARLLAKLRDALLEGAPSYEWSDIPEEMKARRVMNMLKYLMRSTNYQLM